MALLHAIEITKKSAPIIALLNNGVVPETEKKSTYFIFDATWNSDFVPEIITQRDLANTYDLGKCPFIVSLKKAN